MKYFIALLVVIFFFSFELQSQVLVVCGRNITNTENEAISDLVNDLYKIGISKIDIQPVRCGIDKQKYTTILYVGLPVDIEEIAPNVGNDLSPETFRIVPLSKKECIIVGADKRGLFYGIYHFSETCLGIDPFEYWTGKKPSQQRLVTLPAKPYTELAPCFTYRGYFDNDNDHLANFKGRKLVVEFDLWKEMINSLARLRYNYIDIHDLLGRPEYFLRDYYKQLTHYKADTTLINQVIDYAHSKGMMVQAPMYLGWEFYHMDLDKISLSKHYEHWMDVYEYYLTKTPIRKCDLFLQRPRHPYYDWPYKVVEEEKSGINPATMMSKMFEGLRILIKKYRPEAILFCDLWSEGRTMWESGDFAPNKEIKMLWADHGFANFNEWPKNKKGYQFGIYIHAGVWYNNVTQNPYPDKIKEALIEAQNRDMFDNILVNGQTFKNFILNIEACALAAWNPQSFSVNKFYNNWSTRYWGEHNAADVVMGLKYTNQINELIEGYRNVTSNTNILLEAIAKGKPNEMKNTFQVRHALLLSQQVLDLFSAIESRLTQGSIQFKSFDDQLFFPAKILHQNILLYLYVIELNNKIIAAKDTKEAAYSVIGNYTVLINLLIKGSSWEKWKNWYLPQNFRIHTPPACEELIHNATVRFI